MNLSFLQNIIGFDWDEANILKNKKKHALDFWVIEEVFFNRPLLIYHDQKHSENEDRWFVLGETDEKDKLMVVFTIRNNKIRVISARSMSKKERMIYEKAK
jgi:uncharacterized protein